MKCYKNGFNIKGINRSFIVSILAIIMGITIFIVLVGGIIYGLIKIKKQNQD